MNINIISRRSTLVLLSSIIPIYGMDHVAPTVPRQENYSCLAKNVLNHLTDTGCCGICKKPIYGDSVFWFSPHARDAHKECYDFIFPAAQSAYRQLDQALPEINGKSRQANDAHIILVALVQTKIGSSTILDFAKTTGGMPVLENLFNDYIDVAIKNVNGALL